MAKKKKNKSKNKALPRHKKSNKYLNDLQSALELGERYLYSQQETKIPDLLLPFKEDVHSKEKSVISRFNRLLIIGYAHLNKFTEAEEVYKKSIEQKDESVDYYFILAFIHLSLREYEQVKKCAEKYFSLIKKADYPYVQYSASANHESQMHNFLGSVYMETEEFEQAEEQFNLSIKKDSGNHLPYINLSNIYLNQNKHKEAELILNNGLKNCRQVQELRLLKENLKNKVTISACMIVKDEEELLPGCLESIRNWVDEIIVVDTGSTDKTVEIAKSYGARIFYQKWEGNFSKHRNFSIEQASCDWVFVIDADERIVPEDINLIKQTLRREDNQIISINVFNVYGKNQEVTTFLPSVRFWRRNINLRYEGIVHNLLKLGTEHPVTRTGIRLEHLGYDLSKEKMSQKFIRSRELLEKQLNENPDNFFALYNYAQLLKSEGGSYANKNIPVIIKSASRAVALTDPEKKNERHIHMMCLDQIAWAHFYDKEYDRAFEYCQKALTLKPNYLDPLILVGHIYANQKKWKEAQEAYLQYLDVLAEYDPSTEIDPLIITNIDNKAGAWYSLALIAENNQQFDLAKDYYHRILEKQNGYLEANSRLAKIYFNENNLSEAKKYFKNQNEHSYKTVESILGLALVYDKKNDVKQAEIYYRNACEQDEFNPHIKIKFGHFLIKNNRDKEGIEQIEKALELQPDSIDINRQAGDILFNLKLFEKAIEVYQKVVKSDSCTSQTLNNLANCYFKLKKYDEAETYYQQALEYDKKDWIVYRNLGLTQASLQKCDAAVISLEKYLEKNDDLPILSILGDLYLKLKEYPKALEYCEKYLSQNPHDYSALFNLSECYLHMGHRDSAVIGYHRVLGIRPDFNPAQERLNELSEPVSKQ